jgi:hypothetical protein
MTKLVTDGSSAETFGELMKSWGPMSEAGLTVWRQMLENMGTKQP